MAKKPTANESQSLVTKLTEPEQKIIATWPEHEKKAIEAWCKGPTIVAFSGKDFVKLEKELIMIQKDVGVKSLLGDTEMERLLQKLRDEFGDFTTAEITHAVNEAIMERLFMDGKMVSAATHYDEFSFLYLSRILKAYQLYRGRMIRKYYEGEEMLRKEELRANATPLTPEQIRNRAFWHAANTFDSYKSEQPMAGLHLVYDTLIGIGLMKEQADDFARFIEEAKVIAKTDARKGSTSARMIMDQITQSGKDDAIIDSAKIRAVKAYYHTLKEKNVELIDIMRQAISMQKQQNLTPHDSNK